MDLFKIERNIQLEGFQKIYIIIYQYILVASLTYCLLVFRKLLIPVCPNSFKTDYSLLRLCRLCIGYNSRARLPHSSLFSILKMTPFFPAKHWLFSSKWLLFRDNALTFQPKWTPFFTVKHWTSKLTPFSPNSQRWVPNTPFF